MELVRVVRAAESLSIRRLLSVPRCVPAPATVGHDKLASILLPVAMISSVVCPAIASIRSSKWWLVISVCGLSSILWFFCHIAE
jgi:hypothetical protein